MRKNKNFFESLICSFKGLIIALKTERNFLSFFINIVITLAINIFTNFSFMQYLIWSLTIIGVFSAECINSAIEKLCDKITTDFDLDIKYIKDVAAGGVMCWGLAFYIIEIVMVAYNVCF